jgi:hypothetical protein
LLKTIEALTPGYWRNAAIANIARLDCARQDETLARCDITVPAPPKAAAWRQALEAAAVDAAAYRAALAKALRDLVCSGDDSAAHVVRGLSRNSP